MQQSLREQVIWIFRDLHSAFTIHQLAKILKRSYGSVYAEVKAMIKEGILFAQTVGPSLLCSLSPEALQNQEVLASLVHSSFALSAKTSFPDQMRKHLDAFVADPQVLLLFVVNKEWHVFMLDEHAEKKHHRSLQHLYIHHYSSTQFPPFLEHLLTHYSCDLFVILKGHELFWRTYAWLKRK